MKEPIANQVVDLVSEIRKNVERPNRPSIDLMLVKQLSAKIGHLGKSRFGTKIQEQIEKFLFNEKPQRPSFVVRLGIEKSNKELFVMFARPAKAPKSYFEAMVAEPQVIPRELSERYPSPAFPICLHHHTEGLASPRMFGIFGENLNEGGVAEVKKNPPAFYLINRFAERFMNYTLPTIFSSSSARTFPHLRRKLNFLVDKNNCLPKFSEASDALIRELENAGGIWLTGHEHYHQRDTNLPYNSNLIAKGTKEAGGLEESRVDVRSALDFFEGNVENWVAEYILAERLLAYPIIDIAFGRKSPSFDTFGSHYLLSCLLNGGMATISKDKLDIPDLPPTLPVLLERIKDAEDEAQQQAAQACRSCSFAENSQDQIQFKQRRLRDSLEKSVHKTVRLVQKSYPTFEMERGFRMLEFFRTSFDRSRIEPAK